MQENESFAQILSWVKIICMKFTVYSPTTHDNFWGEKNHARGEIFIFMHENFIFIHENKKFQENEVFMHEIFMPRFLHA